MNRIHVLDQTTIDRIAAGEVVERPASVVKELVENAIDAGADRISVEIRDGGIKLLRVTDNGKGIAREDVPLAFLRHATSKIEGAEDLRSLSSLGFRGEALSSIAAVSRVELITKRAEDLTAVRYVIEGGRERLSEEVGAPDGTTIIVRDLFFNTPARAKFLKTPMTEGSHVGACLEQLILSNPGISFSFLVNGQRKLVSPGNGKLSDAVYTVYGRDVFRNVLPVSGGEEELRIGGLIGRPHISRGNRNFENFYVNGRYVKSSLLSRAVEDGYGTMLMQHQHPFACITLQVDGALVDVNVHPTKMEVRFSDEKTVYEAIRAAVSGALHGPDLTAEGSVHSAAAVQDQQGQEAARKESPAHADPQERTETEVPKHAAAQERADAPTQTAVQKQTEEPARGDGSAKESGTHSVKERPAEPFETHFQKTVLMEDSAAYASPGRYEQLSFGPRFLSEEAAPNRRIIGQIFSTYWICEYGDEVFVLDQHAAHERVLFEQFMKLYENRQITSQQVSPPVLITLDARREALLRENMTAFRDLGFEIESFGERDYLVRAVPYSLGSVSPDVLFNELLDQLDVSPDLCDMKTYIRKVATEACKAAVKGGGRLSAEEARKLLDDLMHCGDPYHCPHGRPTILKFSRQDVEKLFKRIV